MPTDWLPCPGKSRTSGIEDDEDGVDEDEDDDDRVRRKGGAWGHGCRAVGLRSRPSHRDADAAIDGR